ncbi:hypothetical protein [Morganella psychrotolerans]|uniref:hypothetical protein n=1 Tax=Morganella psychrotolerans TaxID=368603 RepID=UPI0039B11883
MVFGVYPETSLAMAVLGLSLSIGLTASSIAIMSAVDGSKGAAAGSLEATAYELGSGLGITLFGVFMSAIYTGNFRAPPNLPADIAAQAAQSIGDSYLVAHQLMAEQSNAVILAAKAAFSMTHSILLMTAAVLIGGLCVLVFFLLGNGCKKN